MKTLGKLMDYQIMSIDPSTMSLAYSIIDSDNRILDVGKIDLSSTKSIHEKLHIITTSLPVVMEKWKVKYTVIEEAVFIQNFKTSRLISYIIGHTMGVMYQHCKFIAEANPIVWKRGIGYSKVTKAEKEQWEKEIGAKEAKKKAAFERKDRVRQILVTNLGKDFQESRYDSDEIDAIAIGVWYNGVVKAR